MLLGAAGAALVPWRGSVEPLIVLPPRDGGFDHPLRMREVEQYLVNTDSLAMRWDVLVSMENGDHYQLTAHAAVNRKDPNLVMHRELVRTCLANRLATTRYADGRVVTHALELPGPPIHGAYV